MSAVEMIVANRRFHFAIFERCDNPWLVRFVTQLWDAVDALRLLEQHRERSRTFLTALASR
jgi:DNA-binding GntR family transcriptional regulator